MQLKSFVFNKNQKTIDNIEKAINDHLQNNKIKYCTHNESATKGKFLISIFSEEEESDIQVKVFRDMNIAKLEESVNIFLENKKITMKLATQSFSTNTCYLLVFYSSKVNDEKKTKA